MLSTEWHSISAATSCHDNCRTDRRKHRRLSAPQPSAVDHRSQKDLQLWRYGTTSPLLYAISLRPKCIEVNLYLFIYRHLQGNPNRPTSAPASCICAFDWYQGRWLWMTLNCYNFKFSRNFALLRIFRWTDVCCWLKNASEGWFSELCLIYQSCRALTFALARLSCCDCDSLACGRVRSGGSVSAWCWVHKWHFHSHRLSNDRRRIQRFRHLRYEVVYSRVACFLTDYTRRRLYFRLLFNSPSFGWELLQWTFGIVWTGL